ncbi:hypothetical protein [Marinomonas transparens]|uniref:Uncharacterized protein n=1 Tax=Marinomonas transparens TaxID=2795388 RepID=A0A934JZB5_9GAMM|nr:hypothetical protein [Marinomonas transparens]MBJ7539884.1 hypothetical protein [Marinomonas transparens]
MSTVAALSRALGVSDRTVRNHIKDGYALVFLGSGKIDVEKSVHSYVKFQSEMLRQMKANQGRAIVGSSGNTKPLKTYEDWKREKEKQGAIKLRLQNQRDAGELIPVDAMFELYNSPLSAVKNKLLDLSNQIQKRVSLTPKEVALVDDVIRDALARLDGKGLDELLPLITEIIERHSKYHRSSDDDADHTVGEE